MIKTDESFTTSPTIIKPKPSGFYYWAIFGMIFGAVGVYGSIGSRSGWPVVIIFILIWSLIGLMLQSYTIIIDHGTLQSKALLRKTITIRHNDIAMAKLRFSPLQHEILINQREREPVVLNVKPFTRSDIQTIIEFLGDKVVNDS